MSRYALAMNRGVEHTAQVSAGNGATLHADAAEATRELVHDHVSVPEIPSALLRSFARPFAKVFWHAAPKSGDAGLNPGGPPWCTRKAVMLERMIG
jgi:hypothetical protein